MQNRQIQQKRPLAIVLFALLSAAVASASCKGEGLKVDAVEPPFGNIAGDDDVVITGHGFKPGLMVYFRKRKANKIVIESENRVRVKTPAGPEGPVDIVVTDSTGKSVVLEGAYTYRNQSSS